MKIYTRNLATLPSTDYALRLARRRLQDALEARERDLAVGRAIETAKVRVGALKWQRTKGMHLVGE